MEIREKVVKALTDSMTVDFARIDEDDGITGFVVSPKFEGVSAIDRQVLIEESLKNAPDPLTRAERRHVLMIAGLTPDEYETVGARIRVHKIKALRGGTVEILLHGGLSDAQYVRATLNTREGIETTEPKRVAGAEFLMSIRVKGSGAAPLTKAQVIRILESDKYIEMMENSLL